MIRTRFESDFSQVGVALSVCNFLLMAPVKQTLSSHSCLFFYLCGGTCGRCWPIVPAPDDRWWWLWRNWRNKNWQGKPKYSEKTCPSTALSTTNPTCLDPVLNPGRRGGKPATYSAVTSEEIKEAERHSAFVMRQLLLQISLAGQSHDICRRFPLFVHILLIRAYIADRVFSVLEMCTPVYATQINEVRSLGF
jgi:hypothetical protein